MTDTWKRYTLQADRDLPEDEQRTVEVKDLSIRDSLVLGDKNGLAMFVADQVDDKDIKEGLLKLEYGVHYMIAKLVLGSRNYRGFRGGDVQTAIEAFLNGRPLQGLAPEWAADVEIAIWDAADLSEDEVKN